MSAYFDEHKLTEEMKSYAMEDAAMTFQLFQLRMAEKERRRAARTWVYLDLVLLAMWTYVAVTLSETSLFEFLPVILFFVILVSGFTIYTAYRSYRGESL